VSAEQPVLTSQAGNRSVVHSPVTDRRPDDFVSHPDPSGDDRRYADLRADFDELGSGPHVALFYESLGAQRWVAVFVASALELRVVD
jgi:hypothetical protein